MKEKNTTMFKRPTTLAKNTGEKKLASEKTHLDLSNKKRKGGWGKGRR